MKWLIFYIFNYSQDLFCCHVKSNPLVLTATCFHLSIRPGVVVWYMYSIDSTNTIQLWVWPCVSITFAEIANRLLNHASLYLQCRFLRLFVKSQQLWGPNIIEQLEQRPFDNRTKDFCKWKTLIKLQLVVMKNAWVPYKRFVFLHERNLICILSL